MSEVFGQVKNFIAALPSYSRLLENLENFFNVCYLGSESDLCLQCAKQKFQTIFFSKNILKVESSEKYEKSKIMGSDKPPQQLFLKLLNNLKIFQIKYIFVFIIFK